MMRRDVCVCACVCVRVCVVSWYMGCETCDRGVGKWVKDVRLCVCVCVCVCVERGGERVIDVHGCVCYRRSDNVCMYGVRWVRGRHSSVARALV